MVCSDTVRDTYSNWIQQKYSVNTVSVMRAVIGDSVWCSNWIHGYSVANAWVCRLIVAMDTGSWVATLPSLIWMGSVIT